MKWLLYTVAVLAGLVGLVVVVLLLLGGGRGEGRYAASVTISRPPDVVFSWLTEPERLKAWVGWLVEIRTATDGPTRPGTRQTWVMEDRNNNNQRMEIETVVTRMEPGRALVASLDAPGLFTGEVTYELDAVDPQTTRLSYRAVYRYENLLARLMQPIVSRSVQQKIREDLATLEQQAESQ